MLVKTRIKNAYITVVYALLYLPIAVLILYSLNDATYSMQIKSLTLKWYQLAFANEDLWDSVFHSAGLAFLSASLSLVISTLGIISIYYYRDRTNKKIESLFFILIFIPDLVLAILFLVLFKCLKIPLGFFSLLIAHITMTVPFSMLLLKNRILSIDKSLFLASHDLKANDRYTIKTILLPLLYSTMMSAWLLGFALSFDDVLVSYFVAGPDYSILPLYIYSLIRAGISPEINALCSIVFIFTLMIIIYAYKLSGRKSAYVY